MIHLRTLLIVALINAIGSTVSAQSEIYKWRDENGKVHYSNTPPPGGEVEVINQPPPPKDAGKPDERLQQEIKAFDERYEKSKEAEDARRTAQQDQAIRNQNCATAKENLTNLENRGRAMVKEGDTYTRLSEDERQNRISEAQKHVKDYCK